MEPYSAEKNPQAPLRLLSLDGGGVRGLSSLMVLRDLMQSIALEEKRLGRRRQGDHEPLKPCDYFDLIGGTSTGGIIAILLSRLRLNCDQCIHIYLDLAEKIFKYDRSINVFGMKVPTGATRFSGTVLANAIKSSLKNLGFDPDELMWDEELFEETDAEPSIWRDSIWTQDTPDKLTTDSPVAEGKLQADALLSKTNPFAAEARSKPSLYSDSPLSPALPPRSDTWKLHKRQSVHRKANRSGCRGFVLTSLKNALGLPRILSTYDPNDRTTRIWEALRATSAAPTFFEEMQFGTPKVTYLDGGVGFNNPCAEVDYAAKALWEGRSIGVIVSVGTGLQSLSSVKKAAVWLPFGLGTDISLATALAGMATSTARVDNEMRRMYNNSDTKYYRFDVDRGLANISLEQWMKEDEMASLTEQYMSDGEQIRRAKQFGEIMAKLSTLPPKFEIPPVHYRLGMTGRGLLDESFVIINIDFKSGMFRHIDSPVTSDRSKPPIYSDSGISVGADGSIRSVYPVASDLDHDGRREEAAVYRCVKAENICLRDVKTGIPPGRYKCQFIVAFHDAQHTAPRDLVFSVGRPFDASTFKNRFVDVKITPDVAAVLLHPDAVRVRVGKKRYEGNKGKGWMEIEGDVELEVGLEGTLGFIVSKRFEEGVFVDGWSFGGVRLEPVFEERPTAWPTDLLS
ncbi:patatin-like serine [Stagonosporopsis vannaccii]|nr:patatin-like serine [Stagonosporopsis vannaccii]